MAAADTLFMREICKRVLMGRDGGKAAEVDGGGQKHVPRRNCN